MKFSIHSGNKNKTKNYKVINLRNTKDYDYLKDGIPKAGSRLRVRWDEDSEYSCIFLGSTKSYIYNVSKFELKKNSIEN